MQLPSAKARKLLSDCAFWAEFRFHRHQQQRSRFVTGESRDRSSADGTGVAARVMIDGVFGFAATSDLSDSGLETCLKSAERNARALAKVQKRDFAIPATNRVAKGIFKTPNFDTIISTPFSDVVEAIREWDSKAKASSSSVRTSMSNALQLVENKHIITNDGVDAQIDIARIEGSFTCFSDSTPQVSSTWIKGSTSSWDEMFAQVEKAEAFKDVSEHMIALAKAPHAKAGLVDAIIAPEVVGLMVHEAVGHPFEADLVAAGSFAQNQIGKLVCSPLVNICDSGESEFNPNAGGALPVDDEGILTKRVDLIRDGVLVGYMHDRESAALAGVEPTGNSRAWDGFCPPLIRMRNTYLRPGNSDLNEMIASIDDGYFLDSARNGQADLNGEFSFGALRVRHIKSGKIAGWCREVALSGNALDVLSSVTAVSSDFKWGLAGGYCGKMQYAKVDAGGPHIKCRVKIGAV